jgi:hypothetical protein
VVPHGRLPQQRTGVGIEGDDHASLAGADDDLPTVEPHDHRVHEVAVEQVVGVHLVVPAQRAAAQVERHDRVGVQVAARPARAVGELWRAREGGGVGDAEVHEAALAVDRRRVPGATAGVHRRVAPHVCAVDRVELPARRAGLGVEGVDHAVVAADVDPAHAHRHRADEHDAVDD